MSPVGAGCGLGSSVGDRHAQSSPQDWSRVLSPRCVTTGVARKQFRVAEVARATWWCVQGLVPGVAEWGDLERWRAGGVHPGEGLMSLPLRPAGSPESQWSPLAPVASACTRLLQHGPCDPIVHAGGLVCGTNGYVHFFAFFFKIYSFIGKSYL